MSFADRREAIGASAYWLRTWPRQYGVALIGVTVAGLTRYGLEVAFGFTQPFVLFYPIIMLIALLGGFGPALFATLLSGAFAEYFLMEPLNSFAVRNSGDVVGLVLFGAIGVTISWLGDLFRRRAKRLQEFEKAVEGLEEMIVVVDRDYRYVIANRAFLSYRGMKKEDLIGRRIPEILGPGAFETTVKEKLDECFRGKIVQYEMRYRYPERGERDLFISYFPIEGPGGVDRVACVLQDITDQKEAEQSLRLFRALMDQSNDAVEVVGPETLRFLDVNESACKDLGYSREELLAMTVFDINPHLSESGRIEIQKELRESGSVIREVIHQRKDGSTYPAEISLKRVDLDRSYIVVVSRDISDRKRANEALEGSEKRFRTVYERAPVGIALVDPESGRFLRVNPKFCEILGRGEEELLDLDFQRVTHPDDLADSLSKRADLTDGRSAQFELEKRYLRPDGGEVWAYVSVAPMWREQEPQKVYLVMAQDITKPKRAEEALREREDRYRDLVENSGDLVCTHDLEGNLLSVNPAPARLLGCSVFELIKMPMLDLIAPESREQFEAYLERMKTKGADQGLLCVIARNGERRIWEYNNTLRTEGVASPIVRGMARDVTERKRAEVALRSSEQRYRLLFEKTVAGVAIISLDGAVIECNDAWAHMFGHSSATQCYGGQIAQCYVDSAEREELLSELKRSGAFFNRELQLRRKDGTPFWVLLNSVLMTEGRDPFLIQSTVLDTTERKIAEEALRESEARLNEAQHNAHIGSWRYIPDGTFIWSDELYEMFKLPHDVPVTQESIFSVIHPEDRDGKNNRVVQAMGAGSNAVDFQGEYRIVWPDGQVRWVLSRGKIRRDAEGRVLEVVGTVQDITERKIAEQSLRESEERFRVALKDSPITVFSQDRELRYTWIYNPQLYWQHECIGKTDADILGPKKAANLENLKRRVLKTGIASREEVVIANAGKSCALDITIEALFDTGGNVIGITGAAMDIARLREMTDRLQDAKDKLAHEKSYLESEIQTELGFEEVIGQSPALREVLTNVRVVAPTDSTVLLLGETGTGKELVARSVHALSARRDKNFIKLNCAAVPSGLLESELFGHEKGAFTGAISQKLGRIELADKGTLFLDEIGELPLELQPKLLRVLQDREFERLGGVRTLHVDVRIISATNRDLQQDIADRKFREDLFYRLNVFPIELPALRERRSDIPILIHHFVRKHAARMGKHIDVVPDETMKVLQNWNWPGNIRELENMIERMVILSKGRVLAAPPVELDAVTDVGDDNLTEMAREHIIRVLRETNGVLSGTDGAASRLGIKRTTLQSMLKRHGIELHEYRRGSGTFGPS
jgi:PAS domain S-box-containing protein